jgi:large subunit ribosomal protein L3
MKFIVAKKVEMSQRFRDNGEVVPVTVLKADACTVTQVRNAAKDGYEAVQVGCGTAKKPARAQVGHTKVLGKSFKRYQEVRLEEPAALNIGDVVDLGQFVPGEFVHVTGTSKGKGFQGPVKRHGFHGGPASHGHKDNLRMPGSIGAGGIQRVLKGQKMAGRMGGDRVTVHNLEVVEVDAAQGMIALKGAVPGATGSSVVIHGGSDKKQSWN